MTIALDELATRCQSARRTRNGWQARCPAHDDHKASLSIGKGEDGRVLIHCHAGCASADILAALQIASADLFATPPANSNEPIAVYRYRDESGAELFRKERLVGKCFRQRNAKGQPNLHGVRRVLYRLPELIAAAPELIVFLVEGEKDADTLAALGLVATCNPEGAGRWRRDYSLMLTGKRVVIVPDNDAPGLAHANAVHGAIADVAAQVVVLELPGLREKGDVSDWLATDHTADELCDLGSAALDSTRPRLELICTADVEAKPVTWLWQRRVPLGSITVLDGDPGLGKSTLTIDIAARVTRGVAMPEANGAAAALADARAVSGDVLLISCEDSLETTLTPRLKAADADLRRAHYLRAVFDGEAQPKDGGRFLDLPGDLPLVEEQIAKLGVRLLVIDPLMAYLGSGVESHKDQDIRRFLAPLAKMAERRDCAVLVVRHLNKSKHGSAIYRGGGSIGIIGAARSALIVGRDPDDENLRILAPTKNNVSMMADSLRFQPITIHDETIGFETSRIEWLGATDKSADDLLGRRQTKAERSALEDAQSFLSAELATTSISARDLRRRAADAGHAFITIRRAANTLGIRKHKAGKGAWYWTLPHAVISQPESG